MTLAANSRDKSVDSAECDVSKHICQHKRASALTYSLSNLGNMVNIVLKLALVKLSELGAQNNSKTLRQIHVGSSFNE